MELLEKVAYLKGMLNGMDLDSDKKETRLITAMIDVIDDLAASVTDLEERWSSIWTLASADAMIAATIIATAKNNF